MLVLNTWTLESWKIEATTQPPGGLEPGTRGLIIQLKAARLFKYVWPFVTTRH